MDLEERRLKALDKLGLASFGFFLVLLGVIFVITPSLDGEIVDLFEDFEIVEVYPNVTLPAPASNHPVLYTAVAEFCIAFGLFHIAILILRLYFRDYLNRKAGAFSEAVFWLGAGYLLNILSAEIVGWFTFLSWLIILVGVALVVRSLLILLFETVLRGYF